MKRERSGGRWIGIALLLVLWGPGWLGLPRPGQFLPQVIEARQSDKPAGKPVDQAGDKAVFKIEDLDWMSGDWEMASGRLQIDEHWTKVAGGSLIGMSRTVAGGKTVFFEYLRIEARGTEIYFVAHPRARNPGTDFKLVRLSGREALFENPAHDFPKRILYRRNGDGTLTARIEGDGTEKEKPQEFNYRPNPRAN